MYTSNNLSGSMSLHWDASYEIVLELMARYPDADVDSIGIQQLHQMIVTLPNFEDDPADGHIGVLSEILGEWYEEVNS